MFERIIKGFIGGNNTEKINWLYFYSRVIILYGISTIIEPIFTDYIVFLIYSLAFGFLSGELKLNGSSTFSLCV